MIVYPTKIAEVLGKVDPNDRLAPEFDVWSHSIFLAYRGSQAAGTATEDSDTDVIGVALSPRSYIFGLKTFEQYEYLNDGLDIVVYDFKKYIRLLMAANPNLMESLYVPAKDVIRERFEYRVLKAHRDMFITRRICGSYGGYVRSTWHRLDTPGRDAGAARKELIELYGYDVKDASHLYRLLMQGISLIDSGTMCSGDTEIMGNIRAGRMPYEEYKDMITELLTFFDAKSKICDLPLMPEIAEIDKICQEILEIAYSEKYLV